MVDNIGRLVLVQHDLLAAAITAFRLRLLGYDIVSVERGEDVPAAVQDDVPDLVLVETNLPGINGFEVINRLRSQEKTAHVPILVSSPDSTPESVRQAFLAGATDYLLMPFDPATLESKIESLLETAAQATA